MCELFCIRGGAKKYRFDKDALERAFTINSDGAGYLVLDYDYRKKRFEVNDFQQFQGKPKTYWQSNFQNDYADYCDKGDKKKKFFGIDGMEYVFDDEDYPGMSEAERANKAVLLEMERKEELEAMRKDVPIVGFSDTKADTKADEAIDAIYKRQKQLKKHQLMIAHFRMSTSGHEHTNTQPILEGDYITLHNGIFVYDKLPTGYSDTRYFTERLKNESKKIKNISIKSEGQLIDKLLKEAGGSHSIFIYSFKTGQLYYRKSAYASFYWANAGRLGATRKERFPIVAFSALEREVVRL